MKTKLLLLVLTIFFLTNSYSQQEQCGTMKNLEEQLKKDPSLKEKMLQIEQKNQDWIQKKRIGLKRNSPSNKSSNPISKVSLSTATNSLCGYNNVYYKTIAAPIILNEVVSPFPNCTYGGEYVRVNNLIAGRTYRISTVGLNNFDTQITIYQAGGGNAVAFNDDWFGEQSEIYFTPIFTGNYDILINEYDCKSNSLCASLQVELWSIPRPIITIPVVVHVIHNGEAIGAGTNIADAQIQSQIDVLNEDFRRLNADILSVPAVFRGASADPLIQFCLAQQDSNGIITTGIDRTVGPTTSQYTALGVPSDLQCINKFTLETIIKPSTIWDRDKYLNFWVVDLRQLPPTINGETTNELGCNHQSKTLGYAQFPGLAANTDGVVIRYNVFGRVGNLDSTYKLGRTSTHEVGHWLNLKHIWGDEDACAADDLVDDTPLQSKASYGCNDFPFTDTCSQSYPGVMFKNFMDYSDDNCLALFTYGQVARIESTLINQRAGLMTSKGCVLGTLSSAQFDSKEDLSLYPNPTTSKVFFDNSNYNFENVSVVNSLGQEMSKIKFTAFLNNQEIDLNGLSTGVYILKFSNNETSKTIKVIKE